MHASQLSSRCLHPQETRELVVALEHLGLETGRIDVVADAPTSTAGTSRVDQTSISRPARRIGIGIVAGLITGLLLALLATALTDALLAPTLLGAAIGGAAIGGLAGLYSKLSMNTTVADADSGQQTLVRVDVAGLDDETVADVENLIGKA